jgi:cation diffusion facilitator family transporter
VRFRKAKTGIEKLTESVEHREELRSLRLTLVLYVVIMALKLGVYFLSGVMALLAEALHTLSDIFITGFLLIAAHVSRRAADRVHMFGYGRAQNVAALVAATLFISFTSFELYKEAIPHLFRHRSMTYQNVPLVIGVLVVSMLIAAVPILSFLKLQHRGAAARAQFLELFNDELGLLAALVGTLFIRRGIPIADPIATIVVATIIAVNAVRLFRENASFLLGRAPAPEFMGMLEDAARSVPGVLGVHEIRAEYIGPEVVHADVHIEVDSGLSVVDAHAIALKVDTLLEPLMGNGMCQVHVDARQVEPDAGNA